MLSLATTLGLALAAGGAVRTESRTITKSSVYLVKAPSFLSPRTSRPLLRGQRVVVEVPPRAGWFTARAGKDRGYIHLSYVSDRPGAFTLSRTDTRSESLISGNYNLAVGGFTEAQERAYRARNPGLEEGYRRLEPFMPASPLAVVAAPDPEVLRAFVRAGGLRPPEAMAGGGAR